MAKRWRALHQRKLRSKRLHRCAECGSGLDRSEVFGLCENCHAEPWCFHDDYYDPDDDFDDDDEWENAMQECGQSRYGGCTLAGTEFCDFDCPFRDEDLFDDDSE